MYDNQIQPLVLNGSLQQNNMVVIKQPKDGSDLFHAISDAFYIPYKSGYEITLIDDLDIISSKTIGFDKRKFVRNVRMDLAAKLDDHVEDKHRKYYPETYFVTTTDKQIKQTYYSILSNRSLQQLYKQTGNSKYMLSTMQFNLESYRPVEFNLFQEFISLILDKDIYVLDKVDGSVYSKYLENLYKNRNSIVLLYDKINNTYDLVGLREDNVLYTFFKYDDLFIQKIRSKMSK